MASGLDNKLTGQIAEYLVCAELGRHGLLAAPFAGNVPEFDLLVADRHCHSIPIQVKGSRSENWPSVPCSRASVLRNSASFPLNFSDSVLRTSPSGPYRLKPIRSYPPFAPLRSDGGDDHPLDLVMDKPAVPCSRASVREIQRPSR